LLVVALVAFFVDGATLAKGPPVPVPEPLVTEAPAPATPEPQLEEPQGNDQEEEEEPTEMPWPAKDVTFGQVSGLGVDSVGNVHVFHRGSRVWDHKSFDDNGNFLLKSEGPIKETTHLVIDKDSGEIIHKHGANRFYMPHGLRVDGDDNVWVTDVALHQVFKFPPKSEEPSLVLGEAFKSGNDKKHFCQPTSVAVASTGDFFVADGYCNSRVVKFSADGTFLSQFGKSDGGVFPPPIGTFAIPHSLALIEDWDVLCVADREHQRIQCFSAGLSARSIPTGTPFKKADGLGRVFGIDTLNHYLVGVTHAGLASESQLFIVDLESGESKVVQAGLENPHDVAVAEDGTVYVAEIGPNGVRRVHL